MIARGGAADLRTTDNCGLIGNYGPGGSLNMSFSNYRAGMVSNDGAINDGGGNQTDREPLFANAAGGDFHQLPASPTIDAGTQDALLGSADIDGDPRTLGLAPDIGADESPVRDGRGRVLDSSDNCPTAANADQADGDGDGAGDACDPGVGPAPDGSPPLVTGIATDRRWAVGATITALGAGRRVKTGTSFRYTLSEPATVSIAIARARSGRRVGKRCVKPSRKNRRRRRCTRHRRVVALTRAALAGANSTPFSGRWIDPRNRRRALRRGRYRATIVATDAAGNKSAPKRLRFRVVRR